jgi:hypothetical protein
MNSKCVYIIYGVLLCFPGILCFLNECAVAGVGDLRNFCFRPRPAQATAPAPGEEGSQVDIPSRYICVII